MILLHQPPRIWGLPNASPFCMKLETYLKISNIPYEVRPANPRQGPKGKIPFIEYAGRMIGDTSHIIDYLSNSLQLDLDAHLTESQRAQSLLIRRTLEDSYYFALVYGRWATPAGWAIVKRDMLVPLLPLPVRHLLLPLIRKDTLAALKGHGIGRHTEDEVYAIGKADIGAVAKTLGLQRFILGDQVSIADCTLHAMIANTLSAPFDNPLRDETRKHHNLISYCETMNGLYYTDL